ncbi:hypothetical protein PAI11_34870 [Patulibacter medicamentivorans]|uniref:Uncharacterized protein n=1 Tax=Patulibacter medicamentivorans TaxID=1097667 RepID=H0E9G8_9ACTN|nr:hypothetical protein PAI11_34870 [Patulibacter medicamentivorans]
MEGQRSGASPHRGDSRTGWRRAPATPRAVRDRPPAIGAFRNR